MNALFAWNIKAFLTAPLLDTLALPGTLALEAQVASGEDLGKFLKVL